MTKLTLKQIGNHLYDNFNSYGVASLHSAEKCRVILQVRGEIKKLKLIYFTPGKQRKFVGKLDFTNRNAMELIETIWQCLAGNNTKLYSLQYKFIDSNIILENLEQVVVGRSHQLNNNDLLAIRFCKKTTPNDYYWLLLNKKPLSQNDIVQENIFQQKKQEYRLNKIVLSNHKAKREVDNKFTKLKDKLLSLSEKLTKATTAGECNKSR